MYKNREDIIAARETISPPGDTLAEIIELKGISQVDLALRMGRPLKTINEIIKGKAAITPETAIQLERVLGTDADFWLEREKKYRLELAEIEEAERILRDWAWIDNFPIAMMKKLNWISYDNNILSKADSLFSFFEISSRNSFYKYYFERAYETAYRASNNSNTNPYAVSAWLKQGEKQAEKIEAPEYNSKVFKDVLLEVKTLMAEQPENYFKKLQSFCLDAGVKVVYTPSLPQTHLHGSTRWINDTPLIQLTNLYNRNDIFWFTFFHEAGHIIKHGKKGLFVEGLKHSEKDTEKEKEADDFAVKYTLSVEQEAEILESMPLSKNEIVEYAKKFNTHPAMIVGRFAHGDPSLNKIGWSLKFFQKVDLSEV
ncbi:MAG: HigA family addiction module antidote protein [Bacteroidales bacterium]|jgi:addiction module HigA family antidote|nr:HigA family addiction module antidote protein [Bacteroidales bacterium]MDI9553746.1 HigA family addiction module antitoxin [Bacteroidota bacterium]